MPGSLVTLLKRSGLRFCGLGLVLLAMALFIMLIGFHPGTRPLTMPPTMTLFSIRWVLSARMARI